MDGRVFALAAVAALPLACRDRTPPPPAEEPAPPTTESAGPAADSAYAVVPVTNGGTITGAVTWQGERPTLAAVTVPPHGNPAACGASQPSEALAIGPEGGVAGTVVWLRDVTRGAAPDTARTTLVDQVRCRYTPHVVAVPLGASLAFGNSDPGVLHNVHAYYGHDGAESWFNQATVSGARIVRTAERAGLARVVCDAGHAWMTGYVHVIPHPYFAVTDAAGRFSIANVPPGAYTLRAWHEGWAATGVDAAGRPALAVPVERDRAVTVPAGGAVTVDFTLSARGLAG